MNEIGLKKKRKHHGISHAGLSNLQDQVQDNQVNGDTIEIKKKRKKKHKKKHKKSTEKPEVPSANPDIQSKNESTKLRDMVSDTTAVERVESPPVVYPYAIKDDDHCETPREAYEDIAPLLQAIATAAGKSRSSLRIYDPYYCEGSVVENLASLGFTDVYNRLEDFYAKIASDSVPDYDVLVTNPPYSGDNMARLVQFCVRSHKPWFLLLPNYVYTKDYYVKLLPLAPSYPSYTHSSAAASANDSPFYVAPKHRYQYLTPKGRRQQKSAKVTSPFPTFWYCSGGSLLPRRSVPSLCDTRTRVDVSLSTPSSLPLVVLPDSDPRKKRLRNAEKRKKHKNRKKADHSIDNTTS